MHINLFVFSDISQSPLMFLVTHTCFFKVCVKRRSFIDDSVISKFSSFFNFSNSSDNNVELLAATINEHYLAILSQVTPYKTGNNSELVALDIPLKK